MLLVLSAFVAQASPSYPAELQSLSGGPCAPACTVCHATNAGGSGTVTMPFGQALVAEGLTGGSDVDALGNAYMALIDANTDSDGNGTSDAEELARGDDPNSSSEFCDARQPQFGCAHTPGLPAAALGLGVMGLLLRRRVTPRR
ncbi:MAG: hypothetical protein AAGA48_34660 [Myxococcota bacterium]